MTTFRRSRMRRRTPPGAPLRVEAVRTSGTLFSVGARRILVEEIPEDIAVDDLELAVTREGERVLLSDGEHRVAAVDRASDRAAGRRDVIRARRLDGQLWEVEFATLRCPAERLAGGRGCRSRRTE